MGTPVTFPVITALDACDGPVAVDCVSIGANPGLRSGDPFPIGTTTVRCTATDAAGNSATCDWDVLVRDTTPPALTTTLTRTLLWPARNGLLPAGLAASATDVCDGAIPVVVTVFSDEPHGAAPYAPDATGTMPGDLALRMERAYPWPGAAFPGDVPGRVYLVRVTATDAAGNTSIACHAVVVPVMPVGSSILAVNAQAATGLAACLAAPPLAPLPLWNQLLQFTAP
jgi:hypothetical protein